jgi:putative ABC transport system permease protein
MDPLKHLLRRFARTPSFTAIVLLTLTIGIGANTAIFSVVNGVLVKPLPYPSPEQLVGVWHVAPGIPSIQGNVNCSPTMYFTYREENRTFQNLGIWSNGGASITGQGDPEQVQALYMTDGVLDALAVKPRLGRWFSNQDVQPGAAGSVILSYGYWQRKFGGDASVVGRNLIADGNPRNIIGVMPQEFQFLNSTAEIILPHQFDRNKVFLGNFSYQGLARLKPGATVTQANADVGRMLAIWMNAWPTPPGFDSALFKNARMAPKIQPLKEEVVGDIGQVLWVLMATIGAVLLIACANVANLLLVRAEGRQQELAIRAALGAGWGRIARDMLFESVMLGLIGGVLGVGVAYGALRGLVALGPATVPRLREIGIDGAVLGFTLAISLFAGLLFGLVPILKYAGPKIAQALRGGGRTLSQSRERHRARNVLVVTQVALALVLLVGSGLMIRTFQALRHVDPGFSQPQAIQMFRVFIPEAQIKKPEMVLRMQQEIQSKLAAIPGVTAVAFGNSAPMEGFNSNDLLFARDKEYAAGQIPPIRRFRFITPGYHAAFGTRLLAGRDYTWTDLYDLRKSAIVSEGLAREMWGSASAALGKQIREGMKDDWREVIGVVADVYDNGVHQKPPEMVYWPLLMDNFWGNDFFISRSVSFQIRTKEAGTEGLVNQVRKAVWSVNGNLPLFFVRTMDEVYSRSMARTSFTLIMLAIASGMALILGIIGVYGVISYSVSQRSREVGIRMALGAKNGEVQRMFVRYGALLAAIGVAVGLGAAFGLTRFMKSLLFGVGPLDPATYIAVASALAIAAVTASYFPARRATTVDPIEVLRSE